MIWEAVIFACAHPDAPPDLIAEIITVESAGDPWAVNVNGVAGEVQPTADGDSTDAVVAHVEASLKAGRSVDIGLMQVNGQHLGAAELSASQAFDPCTNIALGSEIFLRGYRPALAFHGDTALARQAALSAYNTGTFHRGFANGYVGRYASGSKAAPSASPSAEDDPYRSDMRIDVTFGEGRSDSELADADQRGGSGR